jgi:hypothetical protein
VLYSLKLEICRYPAYSHSVLVIACVGPCQSCGMLLACSCEFEAFEFGLFSTSLVLIVNGRLFAAN